MSNTLQSVTSALDAEVVDQYGTREVWRILWKDKMVIARGRAAFVSKKAARCAFHDTYGVAISTAVLTAQGQETHASHYPGSAKYPVVIPKEARNVIIEELEKANLLKFEKLA